MRRLASTVSIVSCAVGGNRYGIAATAVTSLCAEPASVLLCVNEARAIVPALTERGYFYLNLLQSSQEKVSRAFGGERGGQERFSVGDWQEDDDGLPYLVGAQANLLCRLEGVTGYGTHKIFIGHVLGGHFTEEVNPLIYQDGYYACTRRLEAASAGVTI